MVSSSTPDASLLSEALLRPHGILARTARHEDARWLPIAVLYGAMLLPIAFVSSKGDKFHPPVGESDHLGHRRNHDRVVLDSGHRLSGDLDWPRTGRSRDFCVQPILRRTFAPALLPFALRLLAVAACGSTHDRGVVPRAWLAHRSFLELAQSEAVPDPHSPHQFFPGESDRCFCDELGDLDLAAHRPDPSWDRGGRDHAAGGALESSRLSSSTPPESFDREPREVRRWGKRRDDDGWPALQESPHGATG